MRYATKQRSLLLDVLEKHFDETLSAERIAELIGGDSVSRSAIYRNLSSLEADGAVKRVTLPSSQKTGFRYVGTSDCKKHLHLECKRCGRTFHLAIASSNDLIDSVMRDAGFKIDSATTVLNGICEDCSKD